MSPDERYPRPQLVRPHWVDLCGVWAFAADDDDRGLRESWHDGRHRFDGTIVVPFPPESPLSGVGDPGAHAALWYRREVVLDDLTAVSGTDDRLILHFGAVDYRAKVWVCGVAVGEHEGGHTPFSFDVTEAVAGRTSVSIVVRVEDPLDDPDQPRGKQCSQLEPTGIYTARTSGIWQPVWLERRPAVAVERLTWTPDLPRERVALALQLTRAPRTAVTLVVTLSLHGEVLAEQSVRVAARTAVLDVAIPAAADSRTRERLLWSPERPTLLDAEVRLLDGEQLVDRVHSYVGFRSLEVADGRLLLNGCVYPLRAVLAQGFWPQSHLAPPTPAALRREVELVKELGFNGVRVHQKIEDPRFLHWCDRLGVLVWAEMPSAYRFSTVGVQRLTREWLEVLQRDASSPCIAAWLPFNESWGVWNLEHVEAQRQYVAAIAALTRAVDPTRPVISNDGWENLHSDVVGIHDYTADGADLRARYGDRAGVSEMLDAGRPWRRRICVPGAQDARRPVMLSEFGGVSCGAADPSTWGHVTVDDSGAFLAKLHELFDAVHASRVLAGFCYTQLADTGCETNGLLDAYRRPKLPVEQLRALVTGQPLSGVPVALPAARRPVTAGGR